MARFGLLVEMNVRFASTKCRGELTDAERDAASKFTRQLLHKKLRREVGPVFEVSAQERTEGRGPERDWRKLIQSLHSLVDDSGRQLVRAACDRGLERLSEQVLAIISEHRDALRRPIEESERRITVMKQTIADRGGILLLAPAMSRTENQWWQGTLLEDPSQQKPCCSGLAYGRARTA
jgi:hypothetical protein